MHAIPEAPYTRIVNHLHMAIEEPERTKILALHADVGLYDDNRRRTAVIELKIFSDGKDALDEIATDLHKGDPVSVGKQIPVYGAGLICQTEDRLLDEQKASIEKGIGQPLRYSSTESTGTGEGWEWCFGCTVAQNSNRIPN